MQGPIEVNGKPYNNVMLPLGLDDQQVADVLNYVLEWNKSDFEPVTAAEVAAVKE